MDASCFPPYSHFGPKPVLAQARLARQKDGAGSLGRLGWSGECHSMGADHGRATQILMQICTFWGFITSVSNSIACVFFCSEVRLAALGASPVDVKDRCWDSGGHVVVQYPSTEPGRDQRDKMTL